MYQTFTATTRPEDGPPRLTALRGAMSEAGIDAFIVPRTDAHRGEVVPDCDERLAWLTGFSGSWGMAAATEDRAAIFVDSRYTLQAAAQVSGEAFEICDFKPGTVAAWLKDAMPDGGVCGFDPWLHTGAEITRLGKDLGEGLSVRAVGNPIDHVWRDRPAPPAAEVVVHPEMLAGEAAAAKRARLAEDISVAGASAAVLTVPESICWLLNIRGSDVARTPVVLAFAILHGDGRVDLAVPDPAQVSGEVQAHLGDGVTLHEKDAFLGLLDGLAGRVGLDPDSAPFALREALGARVLALRDPCTLPKAIKSAAEIAGADAAQARDGAAMVEFLAWLDRTAPDGGLTEIDVATALEGFREKTGALKDISFETISGAGPNGAIVHYRVTEETNRAVEPGALLLVDSGGQYQDGTTDITRTMAIGTASEAAIRPYTLVLKGLIGLSDLRWPEGLAGRDVECVARVALWSAGYDYGHGTGHGVGSYLGVHEGPAGLSRRSNEPLKAGMILSNEPGYYREGAFGIRCENLVLVEPAEIPEGGETPMHRFRTLTYVPFDRRLIDPSLLSAAELGWLNDYHTETRMRHESAVSSEAAAWLAAATRAI